MSGTYQIDGLGKVSLRDNDFLGSGGEANVFVKGKNAIKIYHDPSKMIPLEKIKELQKIKDKKVLVPEGIVYKTGQPVGYTTKFQKNSVPLCKFFTKSFKDKAGINNDVVSKLISQMQSTINVIHNSDCLVVDLNEMNELVNDKYDSVCFIDVDSYQTPSYKATAIMNSIRDMTVTNNNWNKNSDWFSFAVLAFQMWIGIHPYKGKHPDYKNSEWVQRMKDGVSVFDGKVRLPKMCNDFSVIPASHFHWMQEVFKGNKRIAPPNMGDSISQPVFVTATFIEESKQFLVETVIVCPEKIQKTFYFSGMHYSVTSTNIYRNDVKLKLSHRRQDQVFIAKNDGSYPIFGVLQNDMLSFYHHNGNKIGEIQADQAFESNGNIYSCYDSNVIENSFSTMGQKVLHLPSSVGTCSNLASKAFDGILIQNLLKNFYVTIPYASGKCSDVNVPELNGYRVVDAKRKSNIAVIVAEKKGVYDRFILTFDKNFTSYQIRIEKDVGVIDVNFTVQPNGVCVLSGVDDVEVFAKDQVMKFADPPFSTSNFMYDVSGSVHYVDGNEIKKAKIK